MIIQLYLLIVMRTCVNSFIPNGVVHSIISSFNANFHAYLGEVSFTLVHDEILRRGLIQSVVTYFNDLSNGSLRINMSSDYYDLRKLYYDYYGKWYCKIELDDLIKDVFSKNVADVDFNSKTKKMPYAHFDSETFSESNKRVIYLTNIVYLALNSKDYDLARQYSGQVLHTIHDFYSHSNWVEQGNIIINMNIGNESFDKMLVADGNDTTCDNNCTLVTVECTLFLSVFSKVAEALGFSSSLLQCPLTYFKCKGNVILLNKLVSGYSVNQKLPGGTSIEKPSEKLKKCSHGGVFDPSSLKEAKGGMNKDSGYYILSPHADLHLRAAYLAINHTTYFFEKIRSVIGNDEYAKFLKLTPDDTSKNVYNQSTGICSGSVEKTLKFYNFNLILVSFMFMYFISF